MSNKITTELTKENNFIELYKLARCIPTSKDNLYIYWASLLVFVFFGALNIGNLDNELKVLAQNVKDLINWSISILGFILAGYSIFASLTDKSLQKLLAKKVHKATGINRLKHTHCLFVKVLIDLIIIIGCCFFVKVVFNDQATIKSNLLNFYEGGVIAMLVSILNSVIDSLFIYMLLLCKSFVYNVYHIIMITTRWEIEKGDKNEQD